MSLMIAAYRESIGQAIRGIGLVLLALNVIGMPACVRSIPRDDPWLVDRSAHYAILYQRGFEKDAQFARFWMDAAERLMNSKYGVTPFGYRMSLYLLPAPA